MPKLTVNGQIIEVDEGCTVLQACEKAKAEVPVFCYYPKLSVAGNCRMCLVEIEGSSKLVASCSMPVSDGMAVSTVSNNVKKARKEVLELLLINHPLDCPICDQGGECDLQDITVAYGPSSTRFHLNKRAVADKHMGPLIKTSMTRCIHCTRCIRFANEIAGVQEVGALGRGENLEITSYLEGAVRSELSGNMIDICPVGALTSKPYALKHRSWELKKTDSIDVLDAVGSNISVHSKDQEVVRILPRLHNDINEEWITDRARFSYDGLKRQRLDKPYVRFEDGKLKPVSWDEAFSVIAKKVAELKPQQIAGLVGNLADCESILSLRLLLDSLGVAHRDCRIDGSLIPYKNRSHYISNTTIAGLEKADCILLIGTNPRVEASLVNARIRKGFLKGGLDVALIGEKADLTYPYKHLGESLFALSGLLDESNDFAKKLKNAKFPAVIIGASVFDSSNISSILSAFQQLFDRYKIIRDDWNGFNILHTAAARVGALDLGFYPSEEGYDIQGILKGCQESQIKFLYLLGVDEIDMTNLKDTFIVYQGHHGDVGAHHANVILPGAAYTEKTAIYVNTEGRPQYVNQAIQPPGDAKEDWKIIRALSERLGKTLPFETQQDVWLRMASENSVFCEIGKIKPSSWENLSDDQQKPKLSKNSIKPVIDNFYMTDVITRHSLTMATCVKEILNEGVGLG